MSSFLASVEFRKMARKCTPALNLKKNWQYRQNCHQKTFLWMTWNIKQRQKEKENEKWDYHETILTV